MHLDATLHSSKYDFTTTPSGVLEDNVSQDIIGRELISITNTSVCLNIDECDNIRLDDEINFLDIFDTDPFIQENANFLDSLLKTEYSQLITNDELIPEKTNEKNPGELIRRSTLHGRQKIEDSKNPGKLITKYALRKRKKIEDPDNPGKLITRNTLNYRKRPKVHTSQHLCLPVTVARNLAILHNHGSDKNRA